MENEYDIGRPWPDIADKLAQIKISRRGEIPNYPSGITNDPIWLLKHKISWETDQKIAIQQVHSYHQFLLIFNLHNLAKKTCQRSFADRQLLAWQKPPAGY
jgi:hypothetical protein